MYLLLLKGRVRVRATAVVVVAEAATAEDVVTAAGAAATRSVTLNGKSAWFRSAASPRLLKAVKR